VSSRFDRLLILLVGVTSLVAALLAALESDSGRRAEQASAEGTRRAVQLFTDIAGTGVELTFKVNAVRSHLELDSTADLRTAVGSASPVQQALARADERAAGRLAELEQDSFGVRTGTDGLQDASGEQQRAAERWQEAVELQNAAVDEADRYGRRQSRAVFGLALVATAGALFGLAGVVRGGGPGWIALGTGAAALAGAVAAGGSALLL
jgi:hypothetical protein